MIIAAIVFLDSNSYCVSVHCSLASTLYHIVFNVQGALFSWIGFPQDFTDSNFMVQRGSH